MNDGDLGAIYFVLVDRFANGDTSNDGTNVDLSDPSAFHGGDLKGILEKLDDLKAMGVKTLWLSPVFRMRTDKFFGHGAFHGYWVEDFDHLEPKFGEVADLVKLSDELHARGMKLVLDIVLNHVAMDSPKVTQKPDWFHHNGELTQWNDEKELTTHDVHGLPDLDQSNPEVFQFLLETSLDWLDVVKPDGFRLDAVKHIENSFWTKYNQFILDAMPGNFLLLGEVLDGDPRQISKTMREGRFNAMFDFPLYFALVDVFCRGQSPVKLASVFSSDRIYDHPEGLVTLLDNHDLPRITTDCGNDLAKVEQALTFQLTARGTPVINYGTESALEGAKEPENRADMDFSHQPLRPIITHLLNLRDTHSALKSGAPLILHMDHTSLLYARVTGDEAALIGVNTSDQAKELSVPESFSKGSWMDGLTNLPRQSGSKITLPPKSTSLILAKPENEWGFAALHEKARTQWKTGDQVRPVAFSAKGLKLKANEQAFIVGSGLEMGVWKPDNALGPLDAKGKLTVKLPVNSAYEFKLIVKDAAGQVQWSQGDNDALFVAAGTAPQMVDVTWR